MEFTGDPSIIILATSFANDLQYLFEQTPKFYIANLHLLRRRLRALSSATISFVSCRGDHFSGYRYRTDSPMNLHLGDSLGRPAAADILPSFSWLLEHTGHQAPPRVLGDGLLHDKARSRAAVVLQP
jgi:hypothetical protein